MHYYQFNIGDYAKSTKYLTNDQDLAYRRLLDICYDTEKPLPKNLPEIAELIGFLKNPRDSDFVVKKYFKLTKSGYVQKRVQREIVNYRAKSDAARANGKLGGRPKGKPKITQSVNLANPEQTGLKANQEPITNNHKPINRESGARPKTFISECYEPKNETIIHLKRNGHKKLNPDELQIFIEHQLSNGNMSANWESSYKKWVVTQRTVFDKNKAGGGRGYTLDELGEEFING